MYRGPTAFYDVALLLITEIDAALAASAYGSVDRVCVVPGEIAWDACECGMLAISPRRFFLSDEFPADALGQGIVRTSPCDLPYLVTEMSITIARCAPQPVGGALTPTCVALDGSARVLISDAYVVLSTVAQVLCELVGADQIVDWVLGEQVARGPDGSCVGSELLAFVSVPR